MHAQSSRTYLLPTLATTILAFSISVYHAPDAQAEVPPRKVEDLKETADLIIIGKVRGNKRVRSTDGEGVVTRHYLVTVQVTATEKGRVTAPGNQVITRGYQVLKTPTNWAGPSGHYTTDKEKRLSVLRNGSRVRMYLTKRPDNTYDIIRPNGFEPLRK